MVKILDNKKGCFQLILLAILIMALVALPGFLVFLFWFDFGFFASIFFGLLFGYLLIGAIDLPGDFRDLFREIFSFKKKKGKAKKMTKKK